MDEKYKEFLEKKAEKYDKKNVTQTVKNQTTRGGGSANSPSM